MSSKYFLYGTTWIVAGAAGHTIFSTLHVLLLITSDDTFQQNKYQKIHVPKNIWLILSRFLYVCLIHAKLLDIIGADFPYCRRNSMMREPCKFEHGIITPELATQLLTKIGITQFPNHLGLVQQIIMNKQRLNVCHSKSKIIQIVFMLQTSITNIIAWSNIQIHIVNAKTPKKRAEKKKKNENEYKIAKHTDTFNIHEKQENTSVKFGFVCVEWGNGKRKNWMWDWFQWNVIHTFTYWLRYLLLYILFLFSVCITV